MENQPPHSKFVGPIALASVLMILVLVGGCANDALKANELAVQKNQALIEQNQLEIARLEANGGSMVPSTSAPVGGACDKKVEAAATRRAGEAYAAGETSKALGYYQDALTACPGSSKAALNLAHTNETLDHREVAIRYYRQAAASNDADSHSIEDAKSALSRLGIN